MASAVPSEYTNQVVVSDEIATFSPEVLAEIDAHVAKYPPERKRSALIPLLLLVIQRERGFVDNASVNFLAQKLDIQVSDVWETATFYSMINMRPVGKYHIQVCKTLSCRIMGEENITEHICNRLGIHAGETTTDGKFTVSRVECLGSCGTAPMLQIGFDYHEDLTTEKVDRILDSLK
ncbi:MAG: NADH-quinone oxidoreductase subunit NuoE [Acidobacteria bacterium]|nr:NADH-quinone oxidoreductase subunit NuoE [Acidobacteriota bacterium]MCA1637078.1 NADH-quinone oxidoreductase subunit NuoE [Acidobacteriota bacterium]